MRALLAACAALLCAATPIHAEPADASASAADPEPEPDVDLEALEGETIEITSEAPVDKAAPAPEQVTREEVRTLPGARGDALEGVRNLPGVAFAASFDGQGDFAIRGTSGADSWYLIDGVTVPGVSHFGGFTSVLPVEMIESIELTPGGFDVEHGRATGGIVELKTRRPRPEWAAAVELSFVHASAFVQGPLYGDQLSFAASVRRSFIDALLPVFLPDDADVSFSRAPRYADGQLRIDWIPSYRHQLSLTSLWSSDQFEFDVDVENAIDPMYTGNFTATDRFWRTIASWRYERGKFSHRATLAFGGAFEEQHINDTHFFEIRPYELAARDDVALVIAPWLRLRAGADVRALSNDGSARIPIFPGEGAPPPNLTTAPVLEFDDTLRDVQSAGYVAADLRPVEAWTVTPGVRVDHFSYIGDLVVQPRLLTSVELGQDWTARGAVGRYTRPHALAETLPDHLRAEKAIHLTAGLERRFGDAVRMQATGFATWLDDLVVADPTIVTGDLLDQYVNRGTGTVQGGELLIRVRQESFHGWLAYTYARSRRVDGPAMDERPFDFDQPHNLVAAGSWQLGRWRLGGRFRLASGTPYTPVEGAVYLADPDIYRPVYGPTNSERLEMSHQLDLRIDREFPFQTWKLSAYLDVSNVYANPRVWGYAYEFDYTEREAQTDLPLLPSIGVRGEF